MHILLAPDSFKESLSSAEVAQALKAGFIKGFPTATFDLLPIGDGGEGTVAALAASLNMDYAQVDVTGPFGKTVSLSCAFKEDLALIEMAELVGLGKIPKSKRNPLKISTKGLGELFVKLAKSGIKKILIGVGGSSTNDGGIGMAAGLGYQFFDHEENELDPIGANLGQVARISDKNVPNFIKNLEIVIITDVSNPLCGSQGAAYVFGSQKGLPQSERDTADKAMKHFYQLANSKIFDQKGAGAGGGMAAGLITFAGGKIVSGIDYILDIVNFDERVKKADLVIVGEGCMDSQSLSGKAPVGVARRTPAAIPVIAICGSLKQDLPDFPTAGIAAAFPIIAEVTSLDDTLTQAKINLERTALNIANLIKIDWKF
ncbi:glycerate kinase [Streptococcus dentiloxodontae]